ncbi:hypothetical protein RN001_012931 [Aquatica leii]|uniref:MI domain-containing protein n=1 Tax=Aquatica leii TaxID=1421715 RepID=A0AAN7S6R3_9COLE|nr:hypothetical protein RN001_012931 [Aquatica leii]
MKKKTPKPTINKSRKQIRKELRKEKKARKHEYYTNRNRGGRYVLNPNRIDEVQENIPTSKKGKQKKIKKVVTSDELHFKSLNKEKREQEKLQEEMRRQRNEQLLSANAEEDRNIKRLEKQLHLNKRKSKSTPKSFIEDGLDYLLEVCDSKNLEAAVAAEQQFSAVNDDFAEDLELMTGKTKKEKKENPVLDDSEESDNNMNEDLSSNEDMDDDDSIEEDDVDVNPMSDEESATTKDDDVDVNAMSDEESATTEDDDVDVNAMSDDESVTTGDHDQDHTDDDEPNQEQEKEGDETWEDIYGRTRGKDGSVLPANENKYVPPAIRAKMEAASSDDKARSEKLKRLQRQLKGLLNRLAESNMHSISSQIEELYMNNSRNDMNDTLTTLLMDSLVTPVLTPERLLLEHILLVAVLHANVGTEVGAHFLQVAVKKYDWLFRQKNSVENKVLDNIVCVIAQLYNYKIVQAQLIYEILHKLSDRFTEVDIECILLVLKSIGFALRKDDPLALKKLILSLQEKANNAESGLRDNARVKFMLDVLLAIKNNNMTKIPNYDTTYSDHLKKLQKTFVHKGSYVTTLNIALEDLLKADEYGKWWVVGSAWTGKTTEAEAKKESAVKTGSFTQKLLDLARAQRMNTDTRRNVFCIVMSAEDYLDAFEQILHLGLKNQQEREIIHVILHCCLQEKVFNPYYALLSQKFCEHDRKFQMTIKFSIWDKLKALQECSLNQLSNLAKLLTHLFLERGLPISTLKIVQFSELDKLSLRFIRQILIGILLCKDEDVCKGVFTNVARSDKLKLFKESLKLFISHFLVSNLRSGAIPDDQKSLLDERAKLVNNILSASDKKIIFK